MKLSGVSFFVNTHKNFKLSLVNVLVLKPQAFYYQRKVNILLNRSPPPHPPEQNNYEYNPKQSVQIPSNAFPWLPKRVVYKVSLGAYIFNS